MTFLYDARYSLVLLRPKNEVKLLTQSALGQICMGNGLYQIGGIIFTIFWWSFLYRIFLSQYYGTVRVGVKNSDTRASTRRGRK